MSKIEIGPDQILIDADIVAKALKIEPQELQQRMRDGTVTSRFERGEAEDAGRIRLTFFSGSRRARITADESGAVLSCTAVDYSRGPTPLALTPEAAEEKPGKAQPMQHQEHIDALLDAALQDTFPASDPIALSFDRPVKGT